MGDASIASDLAGPLATPGAGGISPGPRGADAARETPIVFIVDDDESVRASLARLLRTEGLRVRGCASAQEFLTVAVDVAAPSCVVLDVRMPGVDGLQLQQRLNELGIELPIVFMTGYADVPMSVRAMRSGAMDLLEKPVADDVLLAAIARAIEQSRRVLAARLQVDELQGRYATLTPRERQVFALVASGLLNKQVGATLGTAEKTVKVHRSRVMEKMRAQSLADLVRMAGRLGIDAATT